MAVPVERFLNTRLIECIIGEDKKSYKVHAGVITELSEVLHRLLNSETWGGEKLDHLEWPDVDEYTFECFIQFAYAGNYVPLSPVPIEEPPDPDYRQDEDEDKPIFQQFAERYLTCPPHYLHQYDWCYWTYDPHESPLKSWEPARPSRWEESSEVLIELAKLYIFADRYVIEPLRYDVLHKLFLILEQMPMEEEDGEESQNLTSLIAMLDFVFCFGNTRAPEDGVRPDRLREMLTLYLFDRLGEFWPNRILDLFEANDALCKSVNDRIKEHERRRIRDQEMYEEQERLNEQRIEDQEWNLIRDEHGEVHQDDGQWEAWPDADQPNPQLEDMGEWQDWPDADQTNGQWEDVGGWGAVAEEQEQPQGLSGRVRRPVRSLRALIGRVSLTTYCVFLFVIVLSNVAQYAILWSGSPRRLAD